MEKIKFDIKKLTPYIPILTLLCVSVFVIIFFCTKVSVGGHDIRYHVDFIMAMNTAWENGTFGNRILELICQDYGYGNGLFYSMIPSGMCVLFMQIFNMSALSALSLEFFLIIFSASLVVYFFIKKVFDSRWIGLICACLYAMFPYFLTDIFQRFAFSEIFLMLAIPLAFFGIYELIENSNYKNFLALFISGMSLMILTHFTSTIYICVILLIYILIRIKELLKNYKYIPFLIACGVILLITACFYIPMLGNFGGTQTSNMAYGGFSLWESALSIYTFKEFYLIFPAIVTVITYIMFYISYFYIPKAERNLNYKTLFIIATISFWLITPLFPWFLFDGVLSMLQFSWRLFSIVAIMDCLLIGFVIKHFPVKIVKPIFVSCCFVLSVISVFLYAAPFSTGTLNINKAIQSDSGLKYSYAQGAWGADYHPLNANNDYIKIRANKNIVLDTNLKVEELANYQTINVFSFIITNSENGYVVLNIPYDVCGGIQIFQKETEGEFLSTELEVDKQVIESKEYLKINIDDTNVDRNIIINYQENSDFDNYLKENPFEFIVSSGSATFTNFVKNSSSNYSVSISTTEETKIELPTLYYNGYTATYKTSSGEYNLNIIQNENGFLQVTVKEDGVLTINFTATYVTVANWISIFGLILFLAILCVVFFVPRLYFTKLANKIDEWLKNHKNVAEFLRFLVVGTIATIVDLLVMGIVMYLMEKSIYDSFLNVFINTPTPSVGSTILGTSCGFIAGLLVNYVLSILFVFNEKGKSKSAKGFIIFTVLSAIGLGINALGTYIGFGLLGINQWLTKIVMIIIVLIYNYISKKLILFKGPKEIKFDNAKIKHEDDIIEDDINKNSSQENKN